MPTVPQEIQTGSSGMDHLMEKFKVSGKERNMKVNSPASANSSSDQRTENGFVPDNEFLTTIVNMNPVNSSTPLRNSEDRRCSDSIESSSVFTGTSSDLSSIPQTPDSEKGVPFTGLTINLADPLAEQEYCAPITGYEVMEERARYTVFKIKVVHQTVGITWNVFRRYTDFVRLNRKLRMLFPGLRFALPPKRWFGDNFDPSFLDDRLLGLQAFVNNIMCHQEICQSQPVREFFCMDEPLGGNDSLEESRTRCESLEELVYSLRQDLRGKQSEVELLKGELSVLEAQKETLVKSLRLECSIVAVHGNALKSSSSFRKIHTLNVALLNIIEKVNKSSQTTEDSEYSYSSSVMENSRKDYSISGIQDLIETAVDALQLEPENLSSLQTISSINGNAAATSFAEGKVGSVSDLYRAQTNGNIENTNEVLKHNGKKLETRKNGLSNQVTNNGIACRINANQTSVNNKSPSINSFVLSSLNTS